MGKCKIERIGNAKRIQLSGIVVREVENVMYLGSIDTYIIDIIVERNFKR